MPFFQTPPVLGNQYDGDLLLRDYLARRLPAAMLASVEGEYRELGALAGGPLYQKQLADRHNEPVHTAWDPWGNRIDRIEVSPLWQEAEILAAKHGLVAAAYEQRHGAASRIHQFTLAYLLSPSLDVYSCPLAMTDGAARTLLETGNASLIERAVPRLTSRDPAQFWTSGQWMTERTGGSDVGLSETVARKIDGQWRLWGTKWFTSATTAQMALTLARPEGNGPGGRGLALFYVELRDDHGKMRNIVVNRLKDKLGTRKVPTAELSLEGTPAILVCEDKNGTRNIAPMLNITRTWNAVMAASGMRRAVELARSYAHDRIAFGASLIDKPLHADTLAGIEAEAQAATLLAFRAAELLGVREAASASDSEVLLARVITPLAKLTTGKQAVQVASEALEAFGGAGYVEDTGLPRLLADAQVLPIWEGTTNVLALDTLRALAAPGAVEAVAGELQRSLQTVRDASLAAPVGAVQNALAEVLSWLRASQDRHRLEADARRFALTLGRTTALAYLLEHAQWCLDHQRGSRSAAAARRFAAAGIDLLRSIEPGDSALLARV